MSALPRQSLGSLSLFSRSANRDSQAGQIAGQIRNVKRPRFALVAAVLAATALGSGSFATADEPAKKKEEVAAGPWITQVRWLDDQNLLGTESQGLLFRSGKVIKTTAADTSKLETIAEQDVSVWAVVPLADGKVAASNYKGEVYVQGGGDPQKFESASRWIRALEKAPGDKDLLAGTEDGKLVVLSVADKKETKRIDAHGAAVFDIAFNTAGDRVASVAGDGSVKVWSWPALEPVSSGTRGKDALWAVAFTSDGSQLVTGGADRRIRLWDTASGKFLLNITTTSDWVTSLASVPGGSLVVGGSMNGQLIVVDTTAKLPVTKMAGPGSGIWSVSMSPSGKQLAVATRKHGIALVSADSWQAAAKETAERAASEKPPAPAPKQPK
ncbi:MAG: hypothetical protein U0892_04950 [Pirellulales bacterium]